MIEQYSKREIFSYFTNTYFQQDLGFKDLSELESYFIDETKKRSRLRALNLISFYLGWQLPSYVVRLVV